MKFWVGTLVRLFTLTAIVSCLIFLMYWILLVGVAIVSSQSVDPCRQHLDAAIAHIKTARQSDDMERKIKPNSTVPHVTHRALAVDDLTEYLTCVSAAKR